MLYSDVMRLKPPTVVSGYVTSVRILLSNLHMIGEAYGIGFEALTLCCGGCVCDNLVVVGD